MMSVLCSAGQYDVSIVRCIQFWLKHCVLRWSVHALGAADKKSAPGIVGMGGHRPQNGKFYFSKPYQSKFVYINKNEDVVTNESLLRIVDKEGFQIDSYAIGGNVLKKLLSNNLDIKQEFKVDYVIESEFNYEIKASDKNGENINNVVLTFNKDTIELKKWEISDELNNKTVLEFTKIKKNILISQNLFVVRYKNN